MRFAFAPVETQRPAGPWKSVGSVVPLLGSDLNAKSVTFPGTDCGRATAQMIAPALLPADETVVKKP
jgi:hypothetical protein